MRLSRRVINGTQKWLPFEIVEKIKKGPDVSKMPYYSNPSNDNERCFNLQIEYYRDNSNKALYEMYQIFCKVARKLIAKEMHEKKLYFTKVQCIEYASDAAEMVIEQYFKNDLVIKTSFVAYLRLQVLKVMYSQNVGEQFERWCECNGYNLCILNEMEKEKLKRDFEKEMFNKLGGDDAESESMDNQCYLDFFSAESANEPDDTLRQVHTESS